MCRIEIDYRKSKTPEWVAAEGCGALWMGVKHRMFKPLVEKGCPFSVTGMMASPRTGRLRVEKVVDIGEFCTTQTAFVLIWRPWDV
jgi:hypothetical protein